MAELLRGKTKECSFCSELAAHSILTREGTIPENPDNPKTPDKSRVRGFRFCEKHWQELYAYLTDNRNEKTY